MINVLENRIYYKISVGNLGEMFFSQITMLASLDEPYAHSENMDGTYKFELKKGFTNDSAVVEWLKKAQTGECRYENLEIQQIDSYRKAVMTTWLLQGAIPIQMTASVEQYDWCMDSLLITSRTMTRTK